MHQSVGMPSKAELLNVLSAVTDKYETSEQIRKRLQNISRGKTSMALSLLRSQGQISSTVNSREVHMYCRLTGVTNEVT